MATSFSLATEVQVFACPQCRETVNLSMRQCPFCGAGIDPAVAEREAQLTKRIAHACNDASYLRTFLVSELVFFCLTIVPFLGVIGFAGFTFCVFMVPALCVRWWIRYRSLPSTDPDYANARGTAIWVSAVALLVLTGRIVSFTIR